MHPILLRALGGGVLVLGKALKDYVQDTTESEVNKSIRDGRYEVEQTLKGKLIKAIQNTGLTIFYTLFILCVTVYVLPLFCPQNVVTFTIASFYVFSLLYSCVSNIPTFKIAWTILFRYRLDIKAYVYAKVHTEVSNEVSRQMNNLSFIERTCNSLFGKKQSTISHEITSEALRSFYANSVRIMLTFCLVLGIHVICVRQIIVPYFIQEVTNLGTIQAIFFPFCMSFDYFCNTNLTQWLLS